MVHQMIVDLLTGSRVLFKIGKLVLSIDSIQQQRPEG